jgi:hypothetical protein
MCEQQQQPVSQVQTDEDTTGGSVYPTTRGELAEQQADQTLAAEAQLAALDEGIAALDKKLDALLARVGLL